jgi:hypothetical protein
MGLGSRSRVQVNAGSSLDQGCRPRRAGGLGWLAVRGRHRSARLPRLRVLRSPRLSAAGGDAAGSEARVGGDA